LFSIIEEHNVQMCSTCAYHVSHTLYEPSVNQSWFFSGL